MSSQAAPLPDSPPAGPRDTTRPAQRKAGKPGGLIYRYGPQAWIDMVMSKKMIVERAWPMVHYTLLPILRLTADPEDIDQRFAVIRARREEVRLLDSPRERWRKRYGNFVREAEWCLLELRKHFSREQYESIVVGTSVALAHENSPEFLEMMNSISARSKSKPASTGESGRPRGFQKLAFDMFNPAGFLTGPAEITEFDAAKGSMVMEVPDCAWHVCPKAESLPNPDALPEEGCLLICKGAFEELFNGSQGGLSMEFEPHLPDTSCTVRMTWNPQSPS
jgi:hypothetical protein